MPSRYHPIEDGLWTDEKFDGTDTLPDSPFEERAFFAFLSSNTRQRPSGIYRATDEQLAADTSLPMSRVRGYLDMLSRRGLIVRDGAWLFVVSYFKRLPKHPHLLKAAESQVRECGSDRIVFAFTEKYPYFNQWSADRRPTVAQPSPITVEVQLPGEERRGEELERRGTGEESSVPPPPTQTTATPSEAKRLLDTWHGLYVAKVGSKPRVEGKRDMACCLQLLAGRTLAEAEQIVREHLTNPSPYYAERGLYELRHVVADCNQILARLAGADRASPELPPETRQTMTAIRQWRAGHGRG